MDTIKSVVISLALASAVEAGAIQQRASTTQPDWFKTSPDLYAGTTEQGALPYLAQINPALSSPMLRWKLESRLPVLSKKTKRQP